MDQTVNDLVFGERGAWTHLSSSLQGPYHAQCHISFIFAQKAEIFITGNVSRPKNLLRCWKWAFLFIVLLRLYCACATTCLDYETFQDQFAYCGHRRQHNGNGSDMVNVTMITMIPASRMILLLFDNNSQTDSL